jgi:rare lipoprotein A
MARRWILAAVAVAPLTLAPAAQAAEGIASWYGSESGRRTASGERFDPMGMTCAMRRRDFGTVLTVTVIATGRSARCRLNDYGPARRTGRIIDVSHGTAKALGIVGRGIARVRVE